MTQTKKKSQKSTKKQPIKVQLSKDDLKELLVVLKNFIQEELQGLYRVHDHRLDCHNGRIISLERIENNHRKEIQRLKQHCLHNGKFTHVTYSENGDVISIDYKCKWCGQEYFLYPSGLARKEKRALRKLGVKI